MKHRDHAHDSRWRSVSRRWTIVSNVDQRDRKTQLDTPFGLAKWRPRDKDSARICEALIAIRDRERDMAERDGREWRGLGPRQYAYRLKSAGFRFADGTAFDKRHFRRAEARLKRMRRDKEIDLAWQDVSDGRGIEHVPLAFRDNAQRIDTLPDWVREMAHVRMHDQRIVPELAVETEGLYNLIYDLADRYGARSRGLQGQSSIGARYELAQRVARRFQKGIRTVVLCVVDYDKHSDSILNAIAADAAQHLRDAYFEPDECLKVIRVALTERQIDEHDIPTVEKDGRLTQEAEALPTDVLRAEVEAALRATLDMKIFNRASKAAEPEIEELVRAVKRLPSMIDSTTTTRKR